MTPANARPRTLPRFLAALLESAATRHGSVELAAAIHEVGAMALPVIALVTIFVGTNVTLVGHSVFGQFGRGSDVGIFVALAGVREMVPVAVAFMLAAKSGAGMAALVGTMRLGGQITALEAMAVDPVRYLALPRLLATVIASPCLVALGNAICLASGCLVALLQLHVEPGLYLEAATSHIGPYDLVVGLLKGVVFGIIIGIASLYHGFRAEPSPAGVGRASNLAVVTSTVTCIVVNYFLSQACYPP